MALLALPALPWVYSWLEREEAVLETGALTSAALGQGCFLEPLVLSGRLLSTASSESTRTPQFSPELPASSSVEVS